MRKQCAQTDKALKLLATKKYTKYEAARKAGIAPSTLYRAIKASGQTLASADGQMTKILISPR